MAAEPKPIHPATATSPAAFVANFVINTDPAKRAAAVEEALRMLVFSLRAVKGPEYVADLLQTLAAAEEHRAEAA